MQRKISEFQVGLLTVLALVILIVGMMWLKNIDLSKGSRLYLVDFERVEGMREGDRVRIIRRPQFGVICEVIELPSEATEIDMKIRRGRLDLMLVMIGPGDE